MVSSGGFRAVGGLDSGFRLDPLINERDWVGFLRGYPDSNPKPPTAPNRQFNHWMIKVRTLEWHFLKAFFLISNVWCFCWHFVCTTCDQTTENNIPKIWLKHPNGLAKINHETDVKSHWKRITRSYLVRQLDVYPPRINFFVPRGVPRKKLRFFTLSDGTSVDLRRRAGSQRGPDAELMRMLEDVLLWKADWWHLFLF